MAFISTSKTRDLARRSMPRGRAVMPSPLVRNVIRPLGGYIAPPHEIAYLESEIVRFEKMIEGSDITPPGSPKGVKITIKPKAGRDAELIRNHVENMRMRLREVTPKKVQGKKKDVLDKAMKEFEAIYDQDKPLHDENNPNPEVLKRNVDKYMRWQKKYSKVLSKYENMARTLEPQDPDAGNLRRKKKKNFYMGAIKK